jgi:hypothetical protein
MCARQAEAAVFKWIGIGLGVLALLLIGSVVGLFLAPVGVREAIRDIFVIIIGLFMLISTILTIALLLGLLFAISRIERLARGNVLPKIDEAMLKLNDVLDNTRSLSTSARETVSNAAGTTQFVTERVVSPFIRVSSLVTGVRAAATSLARRDVDQRLDME